MSKKNRNKSEQPELPKGSRNKPYFAGALFVVALVVVYVVGRNVQTEKLQPVSQSPAMTQTRSAVAFVKEGELRFLDRQDNLLSSVDIEIADDEARRTQGLMYRDSMAENQAMLFIFPDEAERSFWMKNTILPLDIIYINAKNQIFTVQKNTVPYSEDSVPSNGPVKYVVEVNAGYCDKHLIKVGDHIEWKRL
jgi:uncharacterized membrane protein (UPF0127 family)